MQEMQETQVQSPGWEDSPGVGCNNPLQYSCLENPMDRGAWRATAHGVAKNQTFTPAVRTQQRSRVQSLVGELRFHKPQGMAKMIEY